jgi:hypothetical protein
MVSRKVTPLAWGIGAAPTDPDHDVADAAVLLCNRRKRPRDLSAAEHRDEPAPL